MSLACLTLLVPELLRPDEGRRKTLAETAQAQTPAASGEATA
jgi:hypothetical protein